MTGNHNFHLLLEAAQALCTILPLVPTGVPAVALALEHVLDAALAQEMLFTTFRLDMQPQFLWSRAWELT